MNKPHEILDSKKFFNTVKAYPVDFGQLEHWSKVTGTVSHGQDCNDDFWNTPYLTGTSFLLQVFVKLSCEQSNEISNS